MHKTQTYPSHSLVDFKNDFFLYLPSVVFHRLIWHLSCRRPQVLVVKVFMQTFGRDTWWNLWVIGASGVTRQNYPFSICILVTVCCGGLSMFLTWHGTLCTALLPLSLNYANHCTLIDCNKRFKIIHAVCTENILTLGCPSGAEEYCVSLKFQLFVAKSPQHLLIASPGSKLAGKAWFRRLGWDKLVRPEIFVKKFRGSSLQKLIPGGLAGVLCLRMEFV